MTQLKKISRQTATEAAISALETYIVGNRLTPGDSLPSEHELCELLDVSRSIVREALQYFKTLGIIESRPRAGARIVQLIPSDAYKGYLPFIAASKKHVLEIAEFRFSVETGMAPLVIKKATKEDIAELRAIAEKMKTATKKTNPGLDTEFHRKFLSITGNSLFASLEPMIVDYFSECSKLNFYRRSTFDEVYRQHCRIVEAMSKRDSHELYESLVAHYKTILEL